MIEWSSPVIWMAGVLAVGGGGVVSLTLGIRKSLGDHRTYAAETFATKSELIRATDNLTIICRRIEDKVDELK